MEILFHVLKIMMQKYVLEILKKNLLKMFGIVKSMKSSGNGISQGIFQ